MKQHFTEYLGDGVYAAGLDEGGRIFLTTSDGISTTNAIAIEPEVWRAFANFVAMIQVQKDCPPSWRRKRSAP